MNTWKQSRNNAPPQLVKQYIDLLKAAKKYNPLLLVYNKFKEISPFVLEEHFHLEAALLVVSRFPLDLDIINVSTKVYIENEFIDDSLGYHSNCAVLNTSSSNLLLSTISRVHRQFRCV